MGVVVTLEVHELLVLLLGSGCRSSRVDALEAAVIDGLAGSSVHPQDGLLQAMLAH